MYNSNVNFRSSAPFLARIEKSFFQIYICLILILFAWTSFNVIRFPYGIDYGEAPLMDQVRRIENRETVYKADINTAPFIISNYPPLYTLFVASINSILKIPLFQTGRMVSLFFSLVSGAIIGLFGYYLTHQKILGTIAAVIFWGNPYVLIWSSLARVDMMALAFSLVGIFILYRRKDSIAWLVVACLCFLASAFSRQTYLLAGPLAGLVWLWHLNHRRSVLFLMVMGISTLMIFGTINAITQGGFYTNIVIANINQYDFSRTLMMFKQLFILWPVILITCAIVIIFVIRERILIKNSHIEDTKPDEFMYYGLGFYSIGAFFTAITVGKVGSDINYFLELTAVCSIWIAIALMLIMDQKKSIKWIALGLIFIQLIWVLIGSIPITRAVIGNRWEKILFYDSLYERIKISTQKGFVLSDDYLDMVVLSGQSIYYQPFEYGQLYQAGLWDPTKFAEEIEQQDFPLVIIGGETINKACCWAPPLVNALNKNYQTEIESDVLILTPKK